MPGEFGNDWSVFVEWRGYGGIVSNQERSKSDFGGSAVESRGGWTLNPSNS